MQEMSTKKTTRPLHPQLRSNAESESLVVMTTFARSPSFLASTSRNEDKMKVSSPATSIHYTSVDQPLTHTGTMRVHTWECIPNSGYPIDDCYAPSSTQGAIRAQVLAVAVAVAR